ncbi:hypothetical protein AB1E33_29115 [Ruegeria sp. 2012CJ15-1]
MTCHTFFLIGGMKRYSAMSYLSDLGVARQTDVHKSSCFGRSDIFRKNQCRFFLFQTKDAMAASKSVCHSFLSVRRPDGLEDDAGDDHVRLHNFEIFQGLDQRLPVTAVTYQYQSLPLTVVGVQRVSDKEIRIAMRRGVSLADVIGRMSRRIDRLQPAPEFCMTIRFNGPAQL